MVREIEGSGAYFRKVLGSYHIDRGLYRVLNFTEGQNDQDQMTALSILAESPSHDSRSILFKNLVNGHGIRTNVLAVPMDTPPLEKDTDELPSEGTTFIARVKMQQDAKYSRSFLVLTDSLKSAEKIVKANISRVFGGYNHNVHVCAVTPAEFIDEAKQLIEKGIRVPITIMRYGGLRKYEDQVRELKASKNPNHFG